MWQNSTADEDIALKDRQNPWLGRKAAIYAGEGRIAVADPSRVPVLIDYFDNGHLNARSRKIRAT
tara:strand:+ start:17473 stop:17667 length:195 start_codon:yes stop_codon:yes gene_type:complete